MGARAGKGHNLRARESSDGSRPRALPPVWLENLVMAGTNGCSERLHWRPATFFTACKELIEHDVIVGVGSCVKDDSLPVRIRTI